MHVVVIAGQARVGKTTLANLIAEEAFNLGMKPVLLSFAEPIKAQARELGYTKEDKPDKYREFCQELGNRMREENPDHWVEIYEQRLKDIIDNEAQEVMDGRKYWEYCVITDDCRYMNELEMCSNYNCTSIFLSFGTRDIPDKNGEWRQHPSEFLANRLASGKQFTKLVTDYVTNDKGEDHLKNKTKEMAPVWCGLESREFNREEGLLESVETLLDLLFDEIEDDEDEET